MIGIQPHHGPGDPVGVAVAVETIRLAAPMIVGTGVATAEEIGVETFEQRLRDELRRACAVIANPMLLGAWAALDVGHRAAP
jgi:TRAP-type C4-dicarboxylate transport system permease small subunit